jgi:hypothetical protein
LYVRRPFKICLKYLEGYSAGRITLNLLDGLAKPWSTDVAGHVRTTILIAESGPQGNRNLVAEPAQETRRPPGPGHYLSGMTI